KLRLYNPSFANIWGFEVEQLQEGTHLSVLLTLMKAILKAPPESFEDQIISTTSHRKPHSFHIHLKDNRILQNSYVPLPDGSHLLSFNDISDSMHFEQALTERNGALETADRVRTDFIQHVSCELEAPLNTVRGFSDILLNQYFGGLNERQNDYCQGIRDSAERLLSLIHDMLDLASLEAGQLTLQPSRIQLKIFLENLSTLIVQQSNEAGVDYRFENKASFENFLADEKRIKQALLKVISNAIKFTPSQGSVILTVSDDATNIIFSILDTGMGMSKEEQARLLKAPAYLSLDLNEAIDQGNSGLGLSLVKSFIELHGGSIEVFSTLGEGTTISLKLPKKLS
ncbi:MAG TPA: ATP-binding protein, partial [Alphaproteobacteria bacterium]|nr:ATP-binding protein [Alphaproteobacteria bacterium]